MKRFLFLMVKNPLLITRFISNTLEVLFYKLTGMKTIVYNLHHDYFYDIFESMYKGLLKHKKVKIYFAYLHQKKELKKYLLERVDKKFLVSNLISPFIPFDMFICPEVTEPDFPVSFLKTKKIEIYHGTGIANLFEKKDVLNRFDIHFAIGPQTYEFLDFAYQDLKRNATVYNIGYSKLDALLHENPLNEELKKLYGLEGKKVILYAPLWSPDGTIHHFGEKLIEELASLDAKILIKPHNSLFVQSKDDNWKQRLGYLEKKFENVIVIKRPNMQELYPISDIMITDTGTTSGLEFSLLKKPLFVFCNRNWFENREHVDVEEGICDTSFCFDNLTDLKKNIAMIFENSEEFKQQLKTQQEKQVRLVNSFLYNPGNATKNAVQSILKELGL